MWLFQHAAFEIYRLTDGAYTRVDRSGYLPDLEIAHIARFAIRPDQDEALRELRRLL